jgi:SAM-dependent methyltransferase
VRYFEVHEDIYAHRLSRGAAGWDDGAYDAFAMRDVVSSWLDATTAAKPGARVLELGCGTGALACMLAARGFRMTGADVSPSAIDVARAMAAKRALPIAFEVADVCSSHVLDEGFDVVIDSHLLHCIALPDERRALLARVASAIAPAGEFWTETMVLYDGLEDTPTRRTDRAGIVWSVIDDPSRSVDAVEHDGRWWLPMRYLAPSAEALLGEFAASGFRIVEWELVPPCRRGEAADFRARLAC